MNFSILNELLLTLIVGAAQGITEFLPISSTAHIRLITNILTSGRDIGLSTSNIIQLGTLIATLQFFKKDLSHFVVRIKEIFSKSENFNVFSHNFNTWRTSGKNYKGSSRQISTDITLTQLFFGSLPIILFGALLKNFVSSSRDLTYIASFLVTGSILMWIGELVYKNKPKEKKDSQFTISEVVLIGLFQSLAIFPGISRSGATISGSLMIGKDRAKAVRFSFLLSIPAILLAGLVDLIGYIRFLISNPNLLPTISSWTDTTISLSITSIIVSVFIAYAVGFISLKWLLKFLDTHSVKGFAIYRIILALAIFGYVIAQRGL